MANSVYGVVTRGRVASCLLSLLALLALALGDGHEECKSLGFSVETACSDCDSLASYVKDAELLAECKKCCTKSIEQDSRTFKSAVLQVCPHRLNGLPHIKEFIDKAAKSYKPRGLKVSLKRNAHPSLVMGAEKVTIRIDNWKAAHIKEYLEDKLKQ